MGNGQSHVEAGQRMEGSEEMGQRVWRGAEEEGMGH